MPKRVNGFCGDVFKKLDIELFRRLKPPPPGLVVRRFDGCSANDRVELELRVFGMKQQWKALIVESGETENEIYFIDEGTVLPAPLRYWRHRHSIMKEESRSVIVHDIIYRTNNKVVDLLMYPLLSFQFIYRKHVYSSYFK